MADMASGYNWQGFWAPVPGPRQELKGWEPPTPAEDEEEEARKAALALRNAAPPASFDDRFAAQKSAGLPAQAQPQQDNSWWASTQIGEAPWGMQKPPQAEEGFAALAPEQKEQVVSVAKAAAPAVVGNWFSPQQFSPQQYWAETWQQGKTAAPSMLKPAPAPITPSTGVVAPASFDERFAAQKFDEEPASPGNKPVEPPGQAKRSVTYNPAGFWTGSRTGGINAPAAATQPSGTPTTTGQIASWKGPATQAPWREGGYAFEEIARADAKEGTTGYAWLPSAGNKARPKGYATQAYYDSNGNVVEAPVVSGYYFWNGRYYPIGGIGNTPVRSGWSYGGGGWGSPSGPSSRRNGYWTVEGINWNI